MWSNGRPQTTVRNGGGRWEGMRTQPSSGNPSPSPYPHPESICLAPRPFSEPCEAMHQKSFDSEHRDRTTEYIAVKRGQSPLRRSVNRSSATVLATLAVAGCCEQKRVAARSTSEHHDRHRHWNFSGVLGHSSQPATTQNQRRSVRSDMVRPRSIDGQRGQKNVCRCQRQKSAAFGLVFAGADVHHERTRLTHGWGAGTLGHTAAWCQLR